MIFLLLRCCIPHTADVEGTYKSSFYGNIVFRFLNAEETAVSVIGFGINTTS